MKDDRQLDISDRQHLGVDTAHHEGEWTEIGTAVVTESIFGKAKVRIIRQHDRIRRAWLMTGLTALAVTAVAVVYWQGTPPASQPVQSTEAVPQAVVGPEPVPAAPPIAKGNPAPVVTDSLATGRAAHPDVHGAGPMPAQTIVPKPVVTRKPRTAPVVTNNDAARNPSDQQPHLKLSDPLPAASLSSPAEPQATTTQQTHVGNDTHN